jgi:2,4-dienoyl-CoA reductase-like NADH-dependent reductase (Old Yellow Enzyme family)
MPEQKASGEPVYAPSAIAAKGGKFRTLEGQPGYVTPTEIDDPRKIIELFRKGAVNAKEAGFDGVEREWDSVGESVETGANHRF